MCTCDSLWAAAHLKTLAVLLFAMTFLAMATPLVQSTSLHALGDALLYNLLLKGLQVL